MPSYDEITEEERNRVRVELGKAVHHRAVQLGVEVRFALLVIAEDGVASAMNVDRSTLFDAFERVISAEIKGGRIDHPIHDLREGASPR